VNVSCNKYVDVDFISTDEKYTPQYKTDGAACCDLVACIPTNVSSQGKIALNYRTTVLIDTGIKVAIPKGWKICIAARSSYAKRGLVCTNSPAQIDEDYRNEIQVITCNIGREIIEINDGDRFAQCWIEPVTRIKWNKKDELEPANSNRVGGFGSTGVQ
jgi:dUTP pyrophosphatase